MKFLSKESIILICCIALLGGALFVFLAWRKTEKIETPISTPAPAATTTAETPTKTKVFGPDQQTIGLSVENRKIESYTFGEGKTKLVFVGGIHGGYEWNSVLLAYQFIDYLKQNPKSIPDDLTVTIIPSANPDGLFKIIGKEGGFTIGDVPAGSNAAGRFNANNVDLNRNFDCGWLARGVWQSKTVSGGTAAFSEPESAAIKKFILEKKPAAVIFWHSKSGTVYGSSCGNGMLDETVDIMNAYAKAADYAAAPTFDQYTVSGDATDWLASIGVPAITVELKTHENIEWPQNLAGVQSLFKYYETKK